MKESSYTFNLVNTNKHLEVDCRPHITATVLAQNYEHAVKKVEWQHPCFVVAP